jgi:hypothetical protein
MATHGLPGIVIHIIIFVSLFAWLAWLIAGGYRRHKKTQVQNRLLDRFSSATDLVAFLETESGRNFMAQISEKIASPAQGVVNSVRIGVLLIFVGMGIMLGVHVTSDNGQITHASSRLDAAGAFIILFLGLGFIVSAYVSLWISRRLNEKEDSAGRNEPPNAK